ncbi:MAG: hypothetical protein ACXACG_15400 [Candidatus Thorarchaeota archaeon]|jgi:hypothetical protein
MNSEDEVFIEVDVDEKQVFYVGPHSFDILRSPKEVPIGSVVFSRGHIEVNNRFFPHWQFWIAKETGLVRYDKEGASDFITKQLRRYIIENDELPENIDFMKISTRRFAEFHLKMSLPDDNFARDLIFKFILKMHEKDIPGTIDSFVGGFDKKGGYAKWWIETDPSGRAKCRECREKIPKGSKRFRRDEDFYMADDATIQLKKHIRCITKRDIGKANVEEIGGFSTLEEEDKNFLRIKFTHKERSWRRALSMSDTDFKSLGSGSVLSIQGGLLERMDFGIGNVDENILSDIRNVLVGKDIPFSDKREIIFDIAIDAVKKQLGKKGITVFLDVEKWLPYAELASLIPKVFNLRKKEMKKCVLNKTDRNIDLTPLWLTHYGYSILSIKHRHAGASEKTIGGILKLFDEVGIKIQVKENAQTIIPVNVSEDMMNYILFIGTGKKKFKRE